jgi:predicted anti-sigma-YlaC factor YlaD
MHRLIQDHLEEVLRETDGVRVENGPVAGHLSECHECREEVAAMRHQARELRALSITRDSLQDDTPGPRAGFYARVMERIEAQRPIDIWELFFDSAFARRIAMASVAMTVLFGFYLVSSERSAQPVAVESQSGMTIAAGLPDKDAVLVNLVTYREQ